MYIVYQNSFLQKVMTDSKGQALIEFSISNLVVISTLTIGSCLIYISFLKYFNHINIYNSIICVAQQQIVLVCKSRLKKKIQSTLLFGKLNTLKLTKKKRIITASIKWTLWKWKFQKVMIFNTLSLKKGLPTIGK